MNIGSKFDIDNPYYDVILWHSFLLSGLVAYPKHLTQNKGFFFKLITCNQRCNAYTVSLEMVERLDVKGPICRISEFQAKIQADSMFLEKKSIWLWVLPLWMDNLFSTFNVGIFHSEKNMYHRMPACLNLMFLFNNLFT